MREDSLQKAERMLAPLSALDLRHLCIVALRRCRKPQAHSTPRSEFGIATDLGKFFFWALAERDDLKGLDAPVLGDSFRCLARPGMAPVLDVILWLTQAGLAVALERDQYRTVYDDDGYPNTLRLTQAGERFFDADDDHPLLPGYVQRICLRCPGLPAGAVALLNDAHICLDHGLMRSAIVVMGLAYEAVIEEIGSSLVSAGDLPQTILGLNASKRLTALINLVPRLYANGSGAGLGERKGLEVALEFADTLRRRRNDAAHTTPRYGFDDREEAEEFFISAGRHLPLLWKLHR